MKPIRSNELNYLEQAEEYLNFRKKQSNYIWEKRGVE